MGYATLEGHRLPANVRIGILHGLDGLIDARKIRRKESQPPLVLSVVPIVIGQSRTPCNEARPEG